jgi:uncharacterized protein (DUF2147 family)
MPSQLRDTKRRTIGALAAALTIVACVGASRAADSTDPAGLWLVEDGSAVVKIEACGPALCGSVVWSRKPTDVKGRPLCGLAVLGAAVKTGANSWGKGWIYSPKADAKYPATLTLAADATLKIDVSAGLFGRDQTWTRPPQTVTTCAP